ncbi:hypothetical protein ACWELQ_35560, partial [Nocardia sp. NPDC004722]
MSITRKSFHAAVVALPIAAVVAAAGIASAAPLPTADLHVGTVSAPAPEWLPAEVRDGVNGVADQVQSQVADLGVGVGIDPERAGRIAAGALGGAALVGIPGALVGGGIGAAYAG